MVRSLLLAVLLAPAALHAQSAPAPRPMPGYDDGEPVDPKGYHDSYGTADTHHRVDQTPPAPYAGAAYGYGGAGYGGDAGPNGDGWRTPHPYARPDQVDQGSPNDAAHRADRDHTAYLNRYHWRDRNQPVGAAQGSGSYAAEHARYQQEMARHQQDLQAYQAEQARYAERIAHWRARADACERGYTEACEGSE